MAKNTQRLALLLGLGNLMTGWHISAVKNPMEEPPRHPHPLDSQGRRIEAGLRDLETRHVDWNNWERRNGARIEGRPDHLLPEFQDKYFEHRPRVLWEHQAENGDSLLNTWRGRPDATWTIVKEITDIIDSHWADLKGAEWLQNRAQTSIDDAIVFDQAASSLNIAAHYQLLRAATGEEADTFQQALEEMKRDINDFSPTAAPGSQIEFNNAQEAQSYFDKVRRFVEIRPHDNLSTAIELLTDSAYDLLEKDARDQDTRDQELVVDQCWIDG